MIILSLKELLLAQAPISLQEGATFEDYLAMEPEEDSVRETYIDPMTLRGPAGAHEVCVTQQLM